MAWMNGQRTVYCRYCGTKGHNRRTCPSRPQEAKRAEREALVGSRAARRCSWCWSEEHDVRQCTVKTADFAAWYERNRVARRLFLEKVNELGFMVGSLIVPEVNAVIPAYSTPGDQVYRDLSDVPLVDIPGKYILMIDKINFDNVFDHDIPKPKGKSYRQVNNQRYKLKDGAPIHATALHQSEGFDYYHIPEANFGVDRTYYWREQFITKKRGPELKWENMSESWRNGISGTHSLWSNNK